MDIKIEEEKNIKFHLASIATHSMFVAITQPLK